MDMPELTDIPKLVPTLLFPSNIHQSGKSMRLFIYHHSDDNDGDDDNDNGDSNDNDDGDCDDNYDGEYGYYDDESIDVGNEKNDNDGD